MSEDAALHVTRLIAIRHGETDWNASGRIQGHTDIALNARGRWQAEQAALALREQAGDISAIYASDLSRAWDTAAAVAAAASVPVQTEPGLRERGFGQFEGWSFPDIERRWPDAALAWRQRQPHWAPPEGGESLAAVRDRVSETVARCASAHPGGLVVLVTHGGVLDTLYRLATHEPVQAPRTWELPNAAINRLLWTPSGLSLVSWADTSHLKEEARDDTSAS